MKTYENYINSLKSSCEEVHLDYFPQVEASDLLYRIITLEDIYLPLSLKAVKSNDALQPYEGLPNIDDLIRRIDERIAQFETNSRHIT